MLDFHGFSIHQIETRSIIREINGPRDKFHTREQLCFIIQEGNWGIHPLQGWTNMIPGVTIKLADEWDPNWLMSGILSRLWRLGQIKWETNAVSLNTFVWQEAKGSKQSPSLCVCLDSLSHWWLLQSCQIPMSMVNPQLWRVLFPFFGCFYNPNAFTPTSPHLAFPCWEAELEQVAPTERAQVQLSQPPFVDSEHLWTR